MGGAVFPPCCLTWDQTMVEVRKIMQPPSKGPSLALLSPVPPTLQPPSTHNSPRDSWILMGKSVLVSCGVTALFPWVLVHTVLFLPSKSLYLQSCVSSGGSMVALMVTSSKRAYAISRSAVPRALAPVIGHCWTVPLQETLKHSSGSVCGVTGSWCTQDLFEPSERLWQVRGLF